MMILGPDATQTDRGAPGAPRCIIVAGPNGSGKTTSSKALVTERHGVERIINPDAIAVGLAGAAELGALPAGKLALEAQRRYIGEQVDFALETTLSGRRWPLLLDALDRAHYRVTVYFLWLPDPLLCMARVKARVMLGGHGVPEADIRRRYASGLQNLREVFMPRVASWHLYDATVQAGLAPIASGGRAKATVVDEPDTWQHVQRAWSSVVKAAPPFTPPRPDIP